MKIVRPQLGMMLKMSTAVTFLAMSQAAMAVGTDAGTSIDNTATVTYQVNGAVQQPATGSASFLVDRVVNFVITNPDSANTVVAPNEQNAVATFLITNNGNSPIDLSLTAINLPDGNSVNSSTDDAQMSATFEFIADNDGDGTFGSLGDDDFVDALPEDGAILVAVLSDAPITLTDGQIAHIELTATAGDPGASLNPGQDGVEGAPLAEVASDDPTVIDTVFDDAGQDGFETSQDGYQVEAATLTIDKVATVISDPINGTTDPFAIPGAIIEYAITITNAGSASATNISIGDVLTTELIFESGNLPSGTGNISVTENGTTTYCTADPADGDGDGCRLDGTDTLTIAGRDSTAAVQPDPIAVGANPVTIRFRAQIDPT